jgi:hypothetical protein
MKYYSDLKREILSFVTIVDGIGEHAKSNKARHRKTNTTYFHLYMESKIIKLIEVESKIVVTEFGGREYGDDSQRMQNLNQEEYFFLFFFLSFIAQHSEYN